MLPRLPARSRASWCPRCRLRAPPRAWHADLLRKAILADAHRVKKLFFKQLSWRNRIKKLSHCNHLMHDGQLLSLVEIPFTSISNECANRLIDAFSYRRAFFKLYRV